MHTTSKRAIQEQSKAEFERGYAERSGLTLEQLLALGGQAIPCSCEADNCCGWEMTFRPAQA